MSRYSVLAADTPIRHRGKVAVFYRQSLRYAVEAVQKFEPNIFIFHLATGERQWYIVRFYLAPNNISMIESVVATLKEQHWGAKLLVTGDLNMNLSETEGDWRGG